MHIVQEAYQDLYNKPLDRDIKIKYSGQFKSFNANIKYSTYFLHLKLSKEWKTVSREIQMGLIQTLLVRIFKGTPNLGYMDLYESFIKNLSKHAPVTKSDPHLQASFERVNAKYFQYDLDLPNLQWGSNSFAKIGCYEYQTDTITMSTILKNENLDILDYIMYHELLHKKLKFYTKSGRSYHHTTEFKRLENQYENLKEIEKQLNFICKKARIKQFFF